MQRSDDNHVIRQRWLIIDKKDGAVYVTNDPAGLKIRELKKTVEPEPEPPQIAA